MTACRFVIRRVWPIALVWIVCGSPVAGDENAAATDFENVLAVLNEQCVDCHDRATREGGLNLERFTKLDDVIADRAIWKRVFDVVEAGQMPLPQSGYELQPDQRDQLLRFVRHLQSLPDPEL